MKTNTFFRCFRTLIIASQELSSQLQLNLGRIKKIITLLFFCVPFFYVHSVSAGTGSDERNLQWAMDVGKQLATELAQICPMADPADLVALNKCQQNVIKSIVVNENMSNRLLWGGKKADKTLDETTLTEFSAPIWSSMYLPLMMFTGRSDVSFDNTENKVVARLEARFRNQLKPGNYPYPFWHEESKWKAYQDANEMVFFIDVEDAKVAAVVRSPRGRKNPALDFSYVEGLTEFKEEEWMWKDKNGELQPKVTLFDGLYDKKNPYLSKVESTYKSFALKMRDNNCVACHVPDNPEKAETLLLLQTPAHAAGEIDGIIRTVRAEVMPVKFIGGEEGIKDPKEKRAFLEHAEAFKLALDDAAAWEKKKK